jgi:hypothetical protein
MIDLLYFVLLSGSIFIFTFFMNELIKYFSYDVNIADSIRLYVEPNRENKYLQKNISVIRGYIDDHLKKCIYKKYENVVSLSDFYEKTKDKSSIDLISDAHKLMYNDIFSNDKVNDIVILCTMNTPRDYFDLVNYILANSLSAKVNILNINPCSDYLTRSSLVKYKKRKCDYFTYSLYNDFSVKKIMKTLTHTILDKHGQIKYSTQLQIEINKDDSLYNKIEEEVPEKYHMDNYNIRFGMVNLEGVDNKELNVRDYLEEIKFEKAIDNQYYKLLLFNYKLNDNVQENFSKKLIPKYAFCIVENNINMPIGNYFKIPELVRT